MITVSVIVFILLLLFYISFLHKINSGLSKIKSDRPALENNEFVSVIIPFRNESETIIENLKCLENQNIAIDKYEVIYIDDCSCFPRLVLPTKSGHV